MSEEQFPEKISWNLRKVSHFLEDEKVLPHEYMKEKGQGNKEL